MDCVPEVTNFSSTIFPFSRQTSSRQKIFIRRNYGCFRPIRLRLFLLTHVGHVPPPVSPRATSPFDLVDRIPKRCCFFSGSLSPFLRILTWSPEEVCFLSLPCLATNSTLLRSGADPFGVRKNDCVPPAGVFFSQIPPPPLRRLG